MTIKYVMLLRTTTPIYWIGACSDRITGVMAQAVSQITEMEWAKSGPMSYIADSEIFDSRKSRNTVMRREWRSSSG